MSFWRLLFSRSATKLAEDQIHQRLVDSQGFRKVVHTVQREGVARGGKKLLSDAAPGTSAFGRLFLDEFKRDMGWQKPEPPAQTPLLPKSHKRRT